MDFSKYLHHVLRIDRERRLGTVQPGCVLDTLRDTAAREARADVRPGPVHAQPLHPRRDARQRLVRQPLAARGQVRPRAARRRQHARTGGSDLRRLPDARRRNAAGRAGADHPRPAAAGARFTRSSRRCATNTPTRSARGSRSSAAASPGTTSTRCLPENGFNVARALVGTESTCVTFLEATLNLVPNPKARSLLVLGYPDIYSACQHLTEILEFKPTALEGLDHLLFEYVKAKGDKTANIEPAAGRQGLPDGRVRRRLARQDSDDQARRCMEKLKKGKNPPAMKLYDDPRDEEMLWKVREGGLGSTAWVPGLRRRVGGVGGLGRPGREGRRLPPRPARAVRQVRVQAVALRPLRPGVRPLPGPVRPVHGRGASSKYRRSWTRRPTWWCSYGGSLSGEHGDGQSRGAVPAEDVRRHRCTRRSASSRRSGTRPGK